MVGKPGFEPGTPCSQSKCASQLRYSPNEHVSASESPRLDLCISTNLWGRNRPTLYHAFINFVNNLQKHHPQPLNRSWAFAIMPHMQRRYKKILFFLFILALITAGGIFYLNTVFLPLQVKDFIVQKAKSFLNRDVSIEKLIFHPGKGFVLENIRINQNNGDPVPLLTIQEVSASVPYPDFFSLWSGRLFIPSITIKNPVIDIKYDTTGQWNFSDLITPGHNKSATPTKTEQKPRFIIDTIKILDGQATITDTNISETINAINMTLQLDLLKSIKFDLNFLIPSHSSVVNATGQFAIYNKELTVSIKAKNVDVPPLLNLSKIPLWVDFKECLLKKTDLNLKFERGEIIITGSVIGKVDLSTTETATHVDVKTELASDHFFFKRKGPHFILKGNFLAGNTALTVDQNNIFTGQFKGPSISMERNGEEFELKGDLSGENTKMIFAGQELTGNPHIENMLFHRRANSYTVTGKASINHAAIKNAALDLKATSASVNAFDLKRENSDFKLIVPNLSADGIQSMYANKAISGNVKGQDIVFSFVNPVVQTYGKFQTTNLRLVIARDITLLGNPDVELTVTKNKDLDDNVDMINYSGTMTLNKDRLEGVPKFDELNELSGTITFNNDQAQTNELRTVIKGSPWKISGKVNNFKDPSVNITARSATLNLEIMKDFFTKKVKSLDTDITGYAENVEVKYEGLVFSKDATEITVSGFLKSAEISSLKFPQTITDINGQVQYAANALDWKNLSFAFANKNYTTSGSLRNFATPNFKSTVSGDNFAFMVDGKTNDRIVTLNSWKGQFHKSPFDLAGTINFRGDIPAINLNGTVVDGKTSIDANVSFDQAQTSNVAIELNGLDIEKLKNTIPALESKNIAGNLSMNTQWSGPLLDPNHWDGSGSLIIKDGKLLEIDVLKGVWKTLFSNLVVDDYKHIAFTQAKGNFKIADGRITTKDLLMKSNAVDLSVSGWMGFNGNINFDIIADVRQAPLVSANAVKALPSTIISQFAKNIVGFKLTGTFSQPQTKYKVLPLKVLKKTTDSVFLGIQGMMEDLLQ